MTFSLTRQSQDPKPRRESSIRCLFCRWEEVQYSGTALLSLVQTCRAMDIRPWEYLADLFARLLDHPASRLAELLPDQWKAVRDSARSAAQTTPAQS